LAAGIDEIFTQLVDCEVIKLAKVITDFFLNKKKYLKKSNFA
jgi:hypothetical protein